VTMRILIIEDDESISNLMAAGLRKWGYEARYVENFQEILEEVSSWEPHLILLDITLPAYNGYHWCSEIRQVSKVPIIFVSSASDNMNIVMAMNMGGDDFISKPFDMEILLAKISAILRRTYSYQGKTQNITDGEVVLSLGDASISAGGKALDLTRNELRILQLLMENVGVILSREEIMNKLWQNDTFIDDNTLTVNVARLRKKMEEIGLGDYIKTRKGIGYYIQHPATEKPEGGKI